MKKCLFILVTCAFAFAAIASENGPSVTYEKAMSNLRGGNARYVAGHPLAWSSNADKRELLSKGQHPFACVVTCSDSRVSPEILFDQSLGDVFVVRLAGNVVTPEAAGSVEYAVEHLGVPLVVVLGHTSCGAVGAAIANQSLPGPVGSIIARIQPAIEAAKMKGHDDEHLASAVVEENARRGAEALIQSSLAIEEAVKKGHVAVCSATYDILTGKTDWLTQLSAPKEVEEPVAVAPAEPAVEHKEEAESHDSDSDSHSKKKERKQRETTTHTSRH